MSTLRALQLLRSASVEHKNSKQTFSHKEIQEKMNEIKYLSSQKTVPKLTLRKEIMHLERKLESVFAIEKKLLKSSKHEDAKVQSLKKQVSNLMRRLQSSQDEELRKRVSKLAHILGDALAKSDSQKDAELSKNILSAVSNMDAQRKQFELNKEEIRDRIRLMANRLQLLKHELEVNKKLEKGNPDDVGRIEASIALLEKKLEEYRQRYPHLKASFKYTPPPAKKEFDIQTGKRKDEEFSNIKHTILFTPQQNLAPVAQKKDPVSPAEYFAQKHIEIVDTGKLETEMITELPLPPPPKITSHRK
jgi:chromosome segregation ATPase